MVPLPDNTSTPELDFYWRLGNYGNVHKEVLRSRLIAAGYKDVRGKMAKDDLVVKAQRLDRGWIIYQNCTDLDLATFMRERGLMRPETWQPISWSERRESIIRFLCRADAELKFNRFVDLPAELRKRVYELYVEALPEVLETPTQPPLARVSRLLRQEVLPVFYSLRTFAIRLVLDESRPRPGWRLDAASSTFLHNLANGQISNIRTIELNVTRRCGHNRDYFQHPCRFVLGLDKAECRSIKEYVFTFKDDASRSTANPQQRIDAVLLELNEVIKNITQRGGEKRFTMEDVYALRRAVESGLRSVEAN
ncbi:hypothetical protein LTR37_015133 [Vermiconidia calcicola]|uniref:Uncharacterized protein n=1 Tax=Vermiconidia calcicola TaxID=1690605 RepID=A0ACC3MRK4_9PEZI|nr:hypothetical protein LTR37_015133 [Vermiconidia calcicola]